MFWAYIFWQQAHSNICIINKSGTELFQLILSTGTSDSLIVAQKLAQEGKLCTNKKPKKPGQFHLTYKNNNGIVRKIFGFYPMGDNCAYVVTIKGKALTDLSCRGFLSF